MLREEIRQHNVQLADAAKGAVVVEPRDYAIFQNQQDLGKNDLPFLLPFFRPHRYNTSLQAHLFLRRSIDMVRKSAVLFILPAVLAAALIGCGGNTNPAKETKQDSAAKDAMAAKPAGAKESEDDTSGLKLLDEADRKLAEQQKVCPVSGSLLGSMEKPHKMTVKGRVIFLCCKDCEDAVNKDPDGTLKKVDALLAKKK